MHHLLSHTSHIADYAEEEYPVVVDYETIWLDRPVHRYERPADFLPLFGDLEPYGPPKDDEFHYCNSAYVVLGLVIEEVSGLSYVDAVGREVLGPAGMGRSGFFRSDEPVPDVAVGYLESGRTNVFSVPVIGGADGGAPGRRTRRTASRGSRSARTTSNTATAACSTATAASGTAAGIPAAPRSSSISRRRTRRSSWSATSRPASARPATS